jgi:uncharacterized protein
MNLIRASSIGDIRTVKALLKKGSDINAADIYGRSALIEAAWGGHIDIVKFLIGNGANINSSDNSGCSALMRASEQGYTQIVSLLIENGADINCRGKVKGTTPLMLAAEQGHLGILEILVYSGARINAADQFEETALSRAYRSEQFNAAKFLKSKGGRGKPERSSYMSNDKEFPSLKKSGISQWESGFSDPDFDDDDDDGPIQENFEDE